MRDTTHHRRREHHAAPECSSGAVGVQCWNGPRRESSSRRGFPRFRGSRGVRVSYTPAQKMRPEEGVSVFRRGATHPPAKRSTQSTKSTKGNNRVRRSEVV